MILCGNLITSKKSAKCRLFNNLNYYFITVESLTKVIHLIYMYSAIPSLPKFQHYIKKEATKEQENALALLLYPHPIKVLFYRVMVC